MYYIYVLYDKIYDKFYIGFTKDLNARLIEHRSGSVNTTKKFKKINLIYYEVCKSKRDAQIRERQLKTGFGRGYLRRRLKYSLAD